MIQKQQNFFIFRLKVLKTDGNNKSELNSQITCQFFRFSPEYRTLKTSKLIIDEIRYIDAMIS